MTASSFKAKALAGLTVLAVIGAGTGMATAQPSAADAHGVAPQSVSANDARLLSEDDDTITVATQDGTITVSEDVAANTITVTDVDGTVEVLDRSAVIAESGLDAASGGIQARGIVKDWKKYLCSAATSAVVGGHGKAWSVALKIISIHPAARAAVAGAHFSAAVFLSTQC